MKFWVDIPSDVRRHIDGLPGHICQRVKRTIALLALNPRPETAKAMEDEWEGYYRIRVDNYRILYTIDDSALIVEIARVAKRGPDTYSELN